MRIVAEAARNVACAGAVPIGVTNNLNFGNPERPEIMWQLVESIEGMAEACRAFALPITGGNVSLYNETDGEAIYPSPVVGIVGLLDDVKHAVGLSFPRADLDIVLLGDNKGDVAGSEFLKVIHGVVRGRPAAPDLDIERALHRLLPAAAREGLLCSANDISDGGLAVALAEGCFRFEIGARVDVPAVDASVVAADLATLYGETPGLVIVTVEPAKREALLDLASRCGMTSRAIGKTGGSSLRIAVSGTVVIDERVVDVRDRWATTLADVMDRAGGAGGEKQKPERSAAL
jgi:phosphoribosylformylglycinamidine synthase